MYVCMYVCMCVLCMYTTLLHNIYLLVQLHGLLIMMYNTYMTQAREGNDNIANNTYVNKLLYSTYILADYVTTKSCMKEVHLNTLRDFIEEFG